MLFCVSDGIDGIAFLPSLESEHVSASDLANFATVARDSARLSDISCLVFYVFSSALTTMMQTTQFSVRSKAV